MTITVTARSRAKAKLLLEKEQPSEDGDRSTDDGDKGQCYGGSISEIWVLDLLAWASFTSFMT